jgi:hypothetical protein
VLERLWHNQSVEQAPPRDGIIVGIPGHGLESTFVPIPPDLNDPRYLAGQAREVMGDPDGYLAWQQVGSPAAPSLFVLSASPEIVDSYLAALSRAGLGLQALDAKPLALIRGVAHRHAIIVDMERAMGTVIIVDEALPRLVRFQPLSLPLLLSPEDKAMRVGEVLYLALQSYNELEHDRPLHPGVPIFLSGSLAHQAVLVDMVHDIFARQVGQLTLPFAIPDDMPVTQFLANMGLAQKQL